MIALGRGAAAVKEQEVVVVRLGKVAEDGRHYPRSGGERSPVVFLLGDPVQRGPGRGEEQQDQDRSVVQVGESQEAEPMRLSDYGEACLNACREHVAEGAIESPEKQVPEHEAILGPGKQPGCEGDSTWRGMRKQRCPATRESGRMSSWYRIFASLETIPEPAGIESVVAGSGVDARISWSADVAGWYRADIALGQSSLVVERWLVSEEGIRAELNTWAGYLETCSDSPNHEALMERAIQARQLFTLQRPTEQANEEIGDRLCEALSRYLAALTQGFYQVDERGFFSADGTLLVRER